MNRPGLSNSLEYPQLQFNTMATLIRYYKKKYMQYRPLYDRLKQQHSEVKRLRA